MAIGGGYGASRKRPRFETQINITPMVDVMLVLLIIFMVTAPMMTSGVNVDLPRASSSPLKVDSKPITVSLKSDGTLYLGDEQVQAGQLVEKLKESAKNDQGRRIFVRADAHIDYGRVMDLMAKINGGGFNHVALLAQPSARS